MSRPVNAAGLGSGAVVGVVVPVLGYALLMSSHIRVSDVVLVGLLLLPVVCCALLFTIPSARPRALGLVVGALIGVAILVGVVVGGVGAIAWLISD